MIKNNNNLKISFITLGCPKNLIDSERMLAQLLENGAILVGSDDKADVIIINTCGFIEDARQEAFDNINWAIDAKHRKQTSYVVVAGCLAQLWAGKLIERFPDIDAVIGLSDRDKIGQILHKITQKPAKTTQNHTKNNCQNGSKISPAQVHVSSFRSVLSDNVRLRLTGTNWAYLRISEGCNQGCTFCTIPAIRGPFRSKPPEDIIAEARELIADGARELNIIGQEVSDYGSDIGYGPGLAGLLQGLNRLPDLKWLRVLYCHPATITDELIDAIAKLPRVVKYIDIPLQHINTRILKHMNRHIDRVKTEALLHKMREKIPHLTLRTTMMVGFPGETEQEFNELLDFVKQTQFNALGAFMYSAEPNTPAALMPDQVPGEVKQQRFDTLMTTQQKIAFDLADKYVGRDVDLLMVSKLDSQQAKSMQLPSSTKSVFDEVVESRPELAGVRQNPLVNSSTGSIADLVGNELNWYVMRHAGQAPEIDSVTYLSLPGCMNIDNKTTVRGHIMSRKDYDLIACYAGR